MHLPDTFCWSKFGTEAGDQPEMILQRKDRERTLNGGTFLWGIGNSIWPSLKQLASSTESPRIIFTPMLSPAAKIDVTPSTVVLWRDAFAFDGTEYDLPEYTTITSRSSNVAASRPRSHYALVCSSTASLIQPQGDVRLDHSKVRNLASGSPIGASQVTSVVRAHDGAWSGDGRYKVAFHADLVYPYFVRLADPVVVPPDVRKGVSLADEDAFDDLRTLRSGKRSGAATLTLW